VPQTSAHFEPVAWWFTRKKIGRQLREHYIFAGELPPRLLALIKELDRNSVTSIDDSLNDQPGSKSNELERAQPLSETVLAL
jgi:hypothetical protein